MNCNHGASKRERCRCEPFVRAYNYFCTARYVHIETPDLRERGERMPDALYQEKDLGRTLVIERTLVVHPPDYIKRHENDHTIIDYLSSHLPKEVVNSPFTLVIPFLHEFQRTDDVRRMARAICEFITEDWSNCKPGEALEFELESPPFYEYCLLHPDDSAWDEDLMGAGETIRYTMRPAGGRVSRFNWERADKNGLSSVLHKALRHADGKFSKFQHAQCVLLLERRGDIYGPVPSEFCELLSSLPIPPEVDEIWDAWIDTPDYDEPYWTFTRLWAKDPSLPSGWRRPEICCTVGCNCGEEQNSEGVFWWENARESEQGVQRVTDDSEARSPLEGLA